MPSDATIYIFKLNIPDHLREVMMDTESEMKNQIGEIVDFVSNECRKESSWMDSANQNIIEVEVLMSRPGPNTKFNVNSIESKLGLIFK